MDDVPDPIMAVFLFSYFLAASVPLRSPAFPASALWSARSSWGQRADSPQSCRGLGRSAEVTLKRTQLVRVAWDPSISRNIEMADVLTTNKKKQK